jgi:hypothetical protein
MFGTLVGLASTFIGASGSGGGSSSSSTRAARPEVAQTFADMSDLSNKAQRDREGERAEGRARTKAIDPASQIVLNLIRQEKEKDPTFDAKKYLSFENIA